MYKIVKWLLTLINMIIPKRNKYIFFRSYFPYPDNIQAVIDEIVKNDLNQKYKIICAGRGFEKYKNQLNFKIIDESYLKGLFWYFLSKYVIWDSSLYLNLRSISSQISVNLWHGVSLKKIGFYEDPSAKPYRMSTYAVTYSSFFAKVVSKAFCIPKEYVLTTGEPRNDYLFHPVDGTVFDNLKIQFDKKNKYIIWMPTFRQSKNHAVNNGKLYEFGFPFLNSGNIGFLNDYCANNNVVLILKWHGSQILPKNISTDKLTNIFFLTTDAIANNQIPFYSLVAECDALITDYSSIYVNYLILNKPICFAYDDMDEYIKDRGFMFEDVYSIMPGKHAKSFDDVIGFVDDCSKGIDNYEKVRLHVNNVLNEHNDDKNAYRLLKVLGLIE